MSALVKMTIPHDVVIPLTGGDIAALFWDCDERAQAEFFNRLGSYSPLGFQLQAVTDTDTLTVEGRVAMARIGEYAHPTP